MINKVGSRLARILLVDDNEHDAYLTTMALNRSKIAVEISHVENGEECLAFLRKEEPYADVETPDLILLDLNMPILDGRGVLKAISEDEKLSHFPVAVLTTSEEEKDVLDMYKLRCSSYIVKPVDFNQFVRVVQEFNNYWFAIVVLPSDS